MHGLYLLPTILISTFASPLKPREWQPASDSAVQCHASDKIISFVVGPQKESVLNNACAAMMPACAYQERHKDLMCTQVMDWKLDGAKTSTQNANVENATNADKLSNWAVQFSVTPAQQSDPATSVMWTRADCYGYFEHIVGKQEPEGCHNSMGSGIGNMTVGGDKTLKGTVFDIKIVPRE